MAERDGPVRTCIGCRERAPRGELVRYVLARGTSDAGRVVQDDGARLPGRGAWLHDSERCRQDAIRKRALRRALRVGGSAVDPVFPPVDSCPDGQ